MLSVNSDSIPKDCEFLILINSYLRPQTEFLLFLCPSLVLCFVTCHLHLIPKVGSQAGAGILVSVGAVCSSGNRLQNSSGGLGKHRRQELAKGDTAWRFHRTESSYIWVRRTLFWSCSPFQLHVTFIAFLTCLVSLNSARSAPQETSHKGAASVALCTALLLLLGVENGHDCLVKDSLKAFLRQC